MGILIIGVMIVKWIPDDIEMYFAEKEYVDTAVIPLIPLSFGEDMKQNSSMAEYITLAAGLLERQFTGRILLLPPFTYLAGNVRENRISELLNWTAGLKDNHFSHIYFLTSDSEWKECEDRLEETLVWIPAVSLERFDDSQKKSIIDNQVKQLLSFFTRKWHQNL
jgi:hypothetical protein